MMTPFVARTLETPDAALCYPLVRLAEPSVTLEAWIAFVRRLNGGPTNRARGVIVAADAGKYIHGMFCYEVKPRLSGGLMLDVDRLVAVDNALCAGTAAALIEAMENLAESLRCSSITVTLPRAWASGPQPVAGVRAIFARHGYRGSVVGLVKPMERARIPAANSI